MNTIHLIYNSLGKDNTGPHRIGTTLLIAVSTCLVSLICALILWVLDIRRRKMIQEDTPADPCRKRKICFFDQECFCFFS
jgi:hypothetical protein